jgi:hypothetical protein
MEEQNIHYCYRTADRLLKWRKEAQGGLLIFEKPEFGFDGVHADTIEKALGAYRRSGGGFYNWYFPGVSTRELIKWLNISRVSDGIDPTNSDGYSCWVTYEEIKEVLATRPHIPSKVEGRRRRQEAARRGKKPKHRRRTNYRRRRI